MIYDEVRNQVIGLTNNTECTVELADTFIDLALRRLDRLVWHTVREEYVEGITYSETGVVTLPTDFQRIITMDVKGDAQFQLRRGSNDEFLSTSSVYENVPRLFKRVGNNLHIRPAPKGELQVDLHYYKKLTKTADPLVEPEWAIEFPNLVVYMALDEAADYFVDDRKQLWNTKAGALLAEINDDHVTGELSGGFQGMTNPYSGGY